MAGRRGSLRGGRVGQNDVEFSVTGPSQSAGVFDEVEEEFSLGFEGRAQAGASRESVGIQQGATVETRRNRGGAVQNRGGRGCEATAAGGRGGRGREAVSTGGRGGPGREAVSAGGRGGQGRKAVPAGGRGGRGCEVAAIGGHGSCIEVSGISGAGCGVATSIPGSGATASSRGRGGGASSTSALEEGGRSSGRGRGGASRDRSQGRGTEQIGQGQLEGEHREKAPKGKNFQPEEERQLARSVLRISQDSITGAGQKGTAFWERIFLHYDERRPSDYRPARSLESKWSQIKHDVAKFIGVLKQCSNLKSSGANAADVLHHALELYKLKSAKKTDFVYLHVWEIVKDVPRWNLGSTLEKPDTSGMKRKEVSSASDCGGVAADSSTDGGTGGEGERGSAATGSRGRPQGTKRAKEDRRMATSREGRSQEQALATKAMAEATREKTLIQKDANMYLLMTHSTDGAISECGARYLRLKQERELELFEKEVADSRAHMERRNISPAPVPVETAEMLHMRVAEALRPPIRREKSRRPQANHDQENDDVTGDPRLEDQRQQVQTSSRGPRLQQGGRGPEVQQDGRGPQLQRGGRVPEVQESEGGLEVRQGSRGAVLEDWSPELRQGSRGPVPQDRSPGLHQDNSVFTMQGRQSLDSQTRTAVAYNEGVPRFGQTVDRRQYGVMNTRNSIVEDEDTDEFPADEEYSGSEIRSHESLAWTLEEDDEAILETQEGTSDDISDEGHGDEEQPEDIDNELAYASNVGSREGAAADFDSQLHKTAVRELKGGGSSVDLFANETYEGVSGMYRNVGCSMLPPSTDSVADVYSSAAGHNSATGYNMDEFSQQHGLSNHEEHQASGDDLFMMPAALPRRLGAHFPQHQPSFMPPVATAVPSCSNSNLQWSQCEFDNPAIDLDNYEGTQGQRTNADIDLDLNSAFY